MHFRRQHAIGPYVVDFCAPAQKLIIEVDGGVHTGNAETDACRATFLLDQGYKILRIWNSRLAEDIGAVVREICEAAGRQR